MSVLLANRPLCRKRAMQQSKIKRMIKTMNIITRAADL